MTRSLVPVLLLLATCAPRPVLARKRTRPVACPGGVFAIDPGPARALGSDLGVGVDTLALSTSGTAELGGCHGTVHMRAFRTFTRIRGIWTGCGGAGRLRLRAKLAAPACDAMHGQIRARRKPRRRFTAVRLPPTTTPTTLPESSTTTTLSPTCGDHRLDPGEACEQDVHCGRRARCTNACACVALDPPPADTSQVLIDDAYRAGTLDRGTALLYRAYALFHDPRLPAQFDGVGPEAEDQSILADIDAAWPDLPAAERMALQPFLLRPSNPQSVFSTAYGRASAGTTMAAGDDDCTTTAPCDDWQYSDSAHFRVWSCGDALADARSTTAAAAESLYSPMTAYMGEPVPDDADNDGAGAPKIDLYVVEPNQARMRDGTCKTIPSVAIAGTVCAPPELTAVGSRERVRSGYILLQPSVARGLSGGRSTIAHEFFHVLQCAHSVDAMRTWLGESTASWAEWRFVPDDAVLEVFTRFTSANGAGVGFVNRLDQSLDLNTVAFTGLSEAYEAFIWHCFGVQQSGPGVVAQIWNTIATGSHAGPGYNGAVDAVLPFATNWKDFIVRNLNDDAVKDAQLPVYYDASMDTRFPHATEPPTIQKLGELGAGGMLTGATSIRRLAAQYLDFTVRDDVHEITFDFSKISGGNLLDLELLLATRPERISGWKHRSLGPGRTLTLCRDRGDDPVYEAIVALGNHDWGGADPLTGRYVVTGKLACCAPGSTCWSGTASVQSNLATPYGTLNATTEASVTWTAVPQDPTGSTFQPTGTATYSGRGDFAGGCTAVLPPTTLSIPSSGGLLQFFPGTPPTYIASGSAVTGNGLLNYQVTCPDDSFVLPADVKPWLQMSAPRPVPQDTPSLLSGTESSGGITYSWSFVRQ